VVGVIATSDKTPLTIGTGNREMHPVLLSIANIRGRCPHEGDLTCICPDGLPTHSKFINVTPQVQAVLSARVYHICVSIIMDGLKTADAHGEVMSDPNGAQRLCHTPLVSWIADCH